jgi:hypothetical protein
MTFSRILNSERGQVLALSALLITVLLGIIGLVIDGGFFYAQRRHAQSAADAASLAATYRLATGGTDAQASATALEYAAANGYDNDGTSNTVTVNIPPTSGAFSGQPYHAEVIIDEEPNTFFIHVLLGSTGGVQGRGVGGYIWLSAYAYALFANSPDCSNPDTLELSGSDVTVNGQVHANANIKVPGSNNDFDGQATYGCDLTNSGTGNTYTPAPATAGVEPFPFSYAYSDFPCTVSFSSDLTITSVNTLWKNDDPDTNELKDNVICATGKITLSRQGVKGNVTLVAQGELVASGSDFDLHSQWNSVLFYTASSSSSALDVSGSGGAWQGLMLAPNGNAKVQGSANQTLSGSVMANTIKSVSGSDFTITALTEEVGGPATVALKE